MGQNIREVTRDKVFDGTSVRLNEELGQHLKQWAKCSSIQRQRITSHLNELLNAYKGTKLWDAQCH